MAAIQQWQLGVIRRGGTPATCSLDLIGGEDSSALGGMDNIANPILGVETQLIIGSDGSFSAQYINSVGTHTTPLQSDVTGFSVPRWFTGAPPSYWVRATLLPEIPSTFTPSESLVGPGTAAVDTWLPLTSNVVFSQFVAGAESSRDGAILLEFSPNAGVLVCSSWVISLFCSTIYF